jgi:hypothetical protein
MRAVGWIFRILGIAALVAGIWFAWTVYAVGAQTVNEAVDLRGRLDANVASVRELFTDVDVVHERSAAVVRDYETGAISDIHDERVEALLRDVNAVMQRSAAVKGDVEKAIDDFQTISATSEKTLADAILPAGLALTCLVASGWLFAIGVAMGKK